MQSLFGRAFLILSCLIFVSCAGNRPKSAQSESRRLESALVREWTIAVDATADHLARAQFGTHQEITIRRGAAQPETNLVTKAFSQQKYEETRAFWATNLNQPEMRWRIVLQPDHTGELHAYVEAKDPAKARSPEGAPKFKPISEPMQWELNGAALRLIFPNRKQVQEVAAHVVSATEWHYPMQPLGGCFIMRPAR